MAPTRPRTPGEDAMGRGLAGPVRTETERTARFAGRKGKGEVQADPVFPEPVQVVALDGADGDGLSITMTGKDSWWALDAAVPNPLAYSLAGDAAVGTLRVTFDTVATGDQWSGSVLAGGGPEGSTTLGGTWPAGKFKLTEPSLTITASLELTGGLIPTGGAFGLVLIATRLWAPE